MLRRFAAATAVLALSAGGATAQALAAETRTLESLRTCPRATCEVTLERGTVQGTRLRIGQPGTTMLIGLTGARAYDHLAVVPAARAEAGAARSALRQRVGIGVATIAGVLAVALVGQRSQYEYRNGLTSTGFPTRLAYMAGISVSGVYLASRSASRAGPHLEEAVRLYNTELPQ